MDDSTINELRTAARPEPAVNDDDRTQNLAQRTDLYRHFDASGNLLYVGVSLSALNRLAQHRDYSKWFAEIATVKIEKFANRNEALDAERTAIRHEHPKYNTTHQLRVRMPVEIEPRAGESRHALLRRLVEFRQLYRESELHLHLPLTPKQIRRFMEEGRLGYVEIMNTTGTRMNKHVTGWQMIDFIEWLQAKPAVTP